MPRLLTSLNATICALFRIKNQLIDGFCDVKFDVCRVVALIDPKAAIHSPCCVP